MDIVDSELSMSSVSALWINTVAFRMHDKMIMASYVILTFPIMSTSVI
jgi:hypothetical protein